MKLQAVYLDAYRQFIDQHLVLDDEVTVLVGRNDTGKTSFLRDFLRNFYGQWCIGTDTPQFLGLLGEAHQRYSLEWRVEDEDHNRLAEAFGIRRPLQRVVARFDNSTSRFWTYELDGVAAPTGVAPAHRNIFPAPAYVHVAGSGGFRERLLPQRFAAQFRRHAGTPLELPTHPESTTPIEGILLRLAGFDSYTRRLPGKGADDPWEPSLPTPGPPCDELTNALQQVAARVTQLLRRWWSEPPHLDFSVSVIGNQTQNSYWVTCEIRTKSGMPMLGTGIRWFVSFALETLFVEAAYGRPLLLFDEPGAPLHPSAQRAALRMLVDAAGRIRGQLIYSTHSPFMLDWSFPQRIRLFERNFETGKGTIDNKPYHPGAGFTNCWDPLRPSIGVTLGDISWVGENNIFVEGVSDQMILANALASAERRGLVRGELWRVSIVPYGSDLLVLKRLLGSARELSARSVGVIDADRQGQRVKKEFAHAKVRIVDLRQFSDDPLKDSAIEDVVGVDDYLKIVNLYYDRFEWFCRLDTVTVRAKREQRSLGGYLEDEFEGMGGSFSKTAIAPLIASDEEQLGPSARGRLDQLVLALVPALPCLESCVGPTKA